MQKISSANFIIENYQKLQREIKNATEKTKKMRTEAELLLDRDGLDWYFGYAFDHFSMQQVAPFNFLEAALHHYPVRSTFRSHIITVATKHINRHFQVSTSTPSASSILVELAPLIASSILLDVCRNGYPQKGMPRYL